LFTPPNEPPSGTGNQAIGEAADNYKASLPPEQPCGFFGELYSFGFAYGSASGIQDKERG